MIVGVAGLGMLDVEKSKETFFDLALCVLIKVNATDALTLSTCSLLTLRVDPPRDDPIGPSLSIDVLALPPATQSANTAIRVSREHPISTAQLHHTTTEPPLDQPGSHVFCPGT